jgi:hypothetical protein
MSPMVDRVTYKGFRDRVGDDELYGEEDDSITS